MPPHRPERDNADHVATEVTLRPAEVSIAC
jgi:hypothetical protein